MLKTLIKLFLVYMKIGVFTFGGGYAMIALIEDEIVAKRGWITKEELADIVVIAESTPGPIAINCSTYVGYKICGIIGSAVATTAVVIPSFVIIYIISLFIEAFLAIELVAYAFYGINCAVGLIIVRTGIKMVKSFKKTPLSVTCFAVSTAGFAAVNFFAINFSPIWFVLAGVIIGIVACFIPKLERKGGDEK